eukprot:TRINITY_DN8966_c0_g1_i1.p1 TRINITY_DN8966_c0_g1~~TRINITY_DN8966_c0_g1_i1.p1  ORF type:complete len:444 (-),score=73.57 TRINITY_DN8966_c0_g1_i1:13-1344(-)
MSSLPPLRVLIAGAGPAGLALANALAVKGSELGVPVSVKMFERAPKLDPIAGGVLSLGTATPTLHRFGLGDMFKRDGVPLNHFRMIDAKTNRMMVDHAYATQFEELLKELAVERGVAFRDEMRVAWLVRRGDFIDSMRENLQRFDNVEVHLGSEIRAYTQDNNGVRLELPNGTTVEGDVLIGCDGIRSAIRNNLVDVAKPVFSGHILAGGVTNGVDMPVVKECLAQWVSTSGTSLLMAPGDVNGGVFWGLSRRAEEGMAEESWFGEGTLEKSLDLAKKHYLEDVVRLIEASEGPILELGLYYRRHITERKWYDGRVGIIGDAAHATLPWIGQGANMAVCDAAVVARELLAAAQHTKSTNGRVTNEQVAEALRVTQEERGKSTALAVQVAKHIGTALHTKNPLVGYLRDRIYPAFMTHPTFMKQLIKDLGECLDLSDRKHTGRY